jgi:transcriptional regulator with XRE-family HTH domain
MPRIADRLNKLFETVHPPGRGPYTLQEVINAVGADGVAMSIGYLSELRNGKRENPKIRQLEALAKFFRVEARYFFDDIYAEALDRDLATLVALRDAGVDRLARRAFDLPADAREQVADLVETLRRYALPEQSVEDERDDGADGGAG